MCKMTIIQLLNKVANGEEVPKEIKYDTMNYIFRNYDYKEIHGELIDEQSSWLEKIDFYKLNDEVEVIEDNKKIEKLQAISKVGDLTIVYPTGKVLMNKINEIIEVLNEKN